MNKKWNTLGKMACQQQIQTRYRQQVVLMRLTGRVEQSDDRKKKFGVGPIAAPLAIQYGERETKAVNANFCFLSFGVKGSNCLKKVKLVYYPIRYRV